MMMNISPKFFTKYGKNFKFASMRKPIEVWSKLYEATARMMRVITPENMPYMMPETTNGPRAYMFDAPTSFMTPISSFAV